MIAKKRVVPLKIRQLEALLRRLPPHHPKIPLIEQDLIKRRTGYRGEKNADYHRSFLPDEYLIFHGLRLVHQHPFQIDTLILAPSFIIAAEIKNISGTLYFEKHSHQVIRQSSKGEDGFSNPLLQVQRHKVQLKGWMEKMKLPDLPIEPLVIISSNSTIIKTNPGNEHIYKTLIHAERLPGKLEKLKPSFPSLILSSKEMNRVKRTFIKSHEPLSTSILESYNILPEEIIRGIQCPGCEQYPMSRIYGGWICPACAGESKNAHIRAILDYFLLLENSITSQRCRNFLLYESKKNTHKFLSTLNLHSSGTTKNRLYHSPSEENWENLENLLNTPSLENKP
ncbi:NERD domain-containing protein [Bacillus infantis]|uniref:nuclease-related domain-containing protein n=1 Tax=Bacillus infantis TaxID=324767 RepID=UPI00101D1D9A|nr:nuclease-related domain-containing protein [Bacillus infantis]RYI28901.1 NERD domain-containing protein [Bacillus infantis]